MGPAPVEQKIFHSRGCSKRERDKRT
jgi:hypothetical protein